MDSRAAIPAASQVGPALGTGGPRSESTRRAILGAARAMFAARGYERTTIRAVAARAGVDASMVMRYFRSKAGLFTAAVAMDLQVPDLLSAPASRPGGSLNVTDARGGLDKLGQRQAGEVQMGVLDGLSGRFQRAGIAFKAVVQDRGNPVRECHHARHRGG